MNTPTIDGYDLSIGDDLGLNADLVCCDQEMDAHPVTSKGRIYTCGACPTVVDVSARGLVSDIHP